MSRFWYPFRSDEMKEICAHLTTEERQELARVACDFGGRYGKSVGMFVAMPVSAITGMMLQTGLALPYVTAIFVAMLISGTLILRRVNRRELAEFKQWQREFFCNTQWAKSQGGFSPQALKFHRFPWQARKLRETWPGATE